MSTLFQDKFRQMPMTIGHATTIIGNKFASMIAKLNRESQVVTTVANFLLRGFERIENGAKSFIEFVGGSSNALRLFGIALAAILGPIALGGLITILGAIFSIGGLVVGALVLLGLAVDDIVTYIDGGQSVFGGFLDWMSEGSAGASAFNGALVSLGAMLSLYIVYLGTLAKAWVLLKYAFIAAKLPAIAAWLAVMGPIGLVIAGIAAVSAAIIYMYKNWEKVKGFFLQVTGGTSVTPSSVASAASSGGNTNVTSNQTVNLTVPPGTPESQQRFLQGAAGVLKSDSDPLKKAARDMNTGGW